MMGFCIGLVIAVLLLDCIGLILLVFIQLPKKGAGAGLAFGTWMLALAASPIPFPV